MPTVVYPTVNFVLADSDCVPTSLFEVAELVNLMTDRASRAEAMQHHTMASSNQCPPAVLLMTESKAELNAGLIIVTGHAATQPEDVDMGLEAPDASMPAEVLRGGLILTPLMGCKARTSLDWTHTWAMLGEWAGKIAFPIPEDGKWPRHGHGIYLRPDYIHRTPPFLTIFEQGALSPMSVFPADFPILCLLETNSFRARMLKKHIAFPQ